MPSKTPEDASPRRDPLPGADDAGTKLERVLANMTDGLVTFDRGWRCIFANEAAARLIGRTMDEMVGRVIWDEVPEAVGTTFHAQALLALEDGRPRSFESHFEAWDRWYENHLYSAAEGITLVFRDITDRKRTNEALRESEERYRRVVETASEGIWQLDADFRTVEVNDRLARMLGYPKEELLGRRISEFAPPEDGADLERRMASRRQGFSETFEHRLLRRDGSIIWTLVSATSIHDGQGAFVGSFGTITDITAPKQTEQALRESERKYRELVEQAPAGISEISVPGGRFLSVNDLACDYLGYTREELLAMDPMDLLDEESKALFRDRMRRLAAGGVLDPRVDYRILDRHGRAIYVSLESSLVRGADGAPVSVTVIAHDVTERRRAELELRAARDTLRAVLDAAPAGVVVADADGRVAMTSATTERILGGPATGEARGPAGAYEIVRPDGSPIDAGQIPLSLALDGRTVENEEFLVRRADGTEAAILVSATPVRSETGEVRGAVKVFQDLTARKRMEEELRHAKAAAEAANAAKSQFLAHMSHELRTPMNAILGMTELALDEELSPDVRDMLATAKDSADALLGLLNDILDLSRVEAGRLHLEQTAFCLREELERTVKALGLRAFQKGLELVATTADDVPDALMGDAMRLRQVLVNLITNAIKFTHAGEVEVRMGLAPGPFPSGAGRGPAEVELEFSVRDTGIGISEADQARIFAPFTQADISTTRRYGGTGLGLAISRQIVDLMGGELRVDSRLGAGSTFSFTARFGALPDTCAATDIRCRGVPVLVVEENATSRAAIVRLLERWLMRPEAVAGMPEALARLRRAAANDRPFELVIASVARPGAGGFALAQEIRDEPRLSRGVVLMISPADQQAAVRRCGELGVTFVEKPVSQPALLAAITAALGLGPAPVARAEEPAGALAEPPARPLRVLVADDTPAAQKLARIVLERRGHTVEVAPDGRRAVELVDAGGFDAVLMDVQMPVMDGYQATTAIRALGDAEKAKVPIIAMTAHALRGDAERCLAAGMDAYIAKPVDGRELVQTVEQHAGGRRPGTPEGLGLTPPFAPDEALRRCFGQPELLREIVASYLDEDRALLERMGAALDRGDAAELAAAAHRLKNTIVYLAAEPATAASQRLVDIGRAGDLTEAPAALVALERELRRLRDAVAPWASAPDARA